MAKLGTSQRPAVLRVQTPARAEEVMKLAESHGIVCIVGIESDKPEDITDIDRALGLTTIVRTEPKIGRNEPCPCGSGRKYKQCCGKP